MMVTRNVICEYEDHGDSFKLYVMNKGEEVGQFDSKTLASNDGNMGVHHIMLEMGSNNGKFVGTYFGVHNDVYMLMHLQENPVGSGKWVVDSTLDRTEALI